MLSKRKKSKKPYKKKFKGVKYIALKLNKYFKKKYPKYTDALPKAREIFEGFKSTGEKVTVKNIFAVTRKKQEKPFKKKASALPEAPELPPELAETSYFFLLSEYPAKISTAPNTLFFRSTISPEGKEDIQGGTEIDYSQVYEEYFRDFVAYINKLKSMTDPTLKLYEKEWFVKCTEPEFDEKTGKWVSLIISVDANGEQDDAFLNYGFDPAQTDKQPDESLLGLPSRVSGESTGEKPLDGKKKASESKGSLEQELELKLSRQRTKESEAKAKELEQQNEKTRLSQRQQELDIKKVELGLMTKQEFRKKWS
jgi:hypothetical protein